MAGQRFQSGECSVSHPKRRCYDDMHKAQSSNPEERCCDGEGGKLLTGESPESCGRVSRRGPAPPPTAVVEGVVAV